MGSIPILVRANLLYVPIISMPDEHRVRLVVQQKFGLSAVNKTLASTLSMAKEAISHLQEKQYTVFMESSVSFLGKRINNWFIYIQSQWTTN